MTQRVTVLEQHLIKMLPEHVYEFLGRSYIFNYQSSGEGTATVEVTNDLKKEWIPLTTLTGEDGAILPHNWKFQRLVGDPLTVYVLQGN